MRHVRHDWRIAASLALTLSLLPAPRRGLTPSLRGQTPSGFTLRGKQHQAEDAPKSGLEETLRAAGGQVVALLTTPPTPVSPVSSTLTTGLEEGAKRPPMATVPNPPLRDSRLPSAQVGFEVLARLLADGPRRVNAWQDRSFSGLWPSPTVRLNAGVIEFKSEDRWKPFVSGQFASVGVNTRGELFFDNVPNAEAPVVTPKALFGTAPATGLEEGVALPLDEASRILESYRRAEGVNTVQVGPTGPVRRLFTQTDNTLTPISATERTKLLEKVAVQNRVVLQYRQDQPLLVRAPAPAELQKAGLATGLEEKDQAMVRAAAEHAAVVGQLRKTAIQAWEEARANAPAMEPAGRKVLLVTANMTPYVPLAVLEGLPVVVIANKTERARLEESLGALSSPKGPYDIVSDMPEATAVLNAKYPAASWQQLRIQAPSDFFAITSWEPELPIVTTVVSTTRDFLNARTGLEEGA